MIDLKALSKEVSYPLHLEDPMVAARIALDGLGQEKVQIATTHDAYTVLAAFLQALLDNDMYAEAACLLWKPTQFTAEPESVQLIFKSLFEENQVLVQGAASMGKSFSIGVWMYLDWRRDPANTNIQVVGPSEDHLEKNLFSHLVSLHKACSIPSPGTVTTLCIALDPHDKYAGIKGLVIPLGKKSAGKLQGVKVKPRKVPHPRLGKMTRLRVVLEEAENIHIGVWEDMINLSANAANKEQFKVIGAYNPKDRSSQVGVRAEPLDGWGSIDIETSTHWYSKRGWKVLRLDGWKSENVVLGWEKFAGLQTKMGLETLTLQAGGMNTAGYYCADELTECLTQRGWLRHDQIRVGDQAWAVDLKTGLGVWSPVREIFAKHFSGELVSVEGRSLSALVTPNHRWPVTDKLRLQRGTGYAIKEASCLTRHNLLPLAVPSVGRGGDVDFAALLGWVITDGTVANPHNRVTLYQSKKANPHKCAMIEALLARLGAGSGKPSMSGDMAHYSFSGPVGAKIKKVLPRGKPFPWRWVSTATASELRAFLDASILGDGGIQGGSTPYVCSVTKEHADGFAAVAAMVGQASTTHLVPPHATTFPGGSTSPGVEMYLVCFIRPKHTLVANNKISKKKYDGIVWCPRTDASTWLCRRNGHVHYTGNTMARGWYPEDGLDTVVFPPALLKDEVVRGEYIWAEEPVNVGALDVALEGGDTAIFKTGRYGPAFGYRALATMTDRGINPVVHFKDAAGRRTYRQVLQVDQIVPIPKGRTEDVGDAAIQMAKALGIRPEWMGIDRTGNGAGVHDYVRAKFGEAVHGINGSSSSTDMRILVEDKLLPCDEYNLLYTELWFALKKWIEVGVCKFAFNLPSDPLISELLGRRYIQPIGNPKIRVEPKKAYKSRGNKSPDRADALTMLLHVVRLQTSIVQSYKTGSVAEVDGPMRQRIDVTNRFESLD